MIGPAAQNFLAGAAGLALGFAFIRCIARERSATIGNFWVDLTRSLLWVLLPLTLIGSLILIWQGVPLNMAPYTLAHTLEGRTQTIAQGPVAALVFGTILLGGALCFPSCSCAWCGRGVLRALVVRPILVAAVVVVIASRQAAGSDAAAAPIVTDRPAVTDSSVVVPPGSLQAENGFAETVSQGQRTFDGPETLLRLGVALKTELRLTAPATLGRWERVLGLATLRSG